MKVLWNDFNVLFIFVSCRLFHSTPVVIALKGMLQPVIGREDPFFSFYLIRRKSMQSDFLKMF